MNGNVIIIACYKLWDSMCFSGSFLMPPDCFLRQNKFDFVYCCELKSNVSGGGGDGGSEGV